jgi:hypothetical protein
VKNTFSLKEDYQVTLVISVAVNAAEERIRVPSRKLFIELT